MVAASKILSLRLGHSIRVIVFASLILVLSRTTVAQQSQQTDGPTNADGHNAPIMIKPGDMSARWPLNLIPNEALPYTPPPMDFPPDRWGNRVPDFSQVGYRGGHVPLPQVPVTITLQPSADPPINDRARIQNAIDWAGRQPLQEFKLRDGKTVIKTRGAVLLQAGIYRIQGALILNKPGVVLRGEGNDPAGTILVAMGQFKHDFINMNGVLDSSFQGTPEYLTRYGNTKAVSPKNPYVIQDRYVARVADKYVPVGTMRLHMKDVSNFNVGAEVVLETQPNDKWVHRLGMDNIPPRPDDAIKRVEANVNQTGQVQSLEAVNSEVEANAIPDPPLKLVKSSGRRIAKNDDNYDDVDSRFRSRSSWLEVPGYLTLDIPTVMNMEAEYGRSYVYNFKRETPIPSDVGVENMALWSEFDPDILTDEHHGWFAVMIDHCENCWVTDIKATNFVSGIKAGPGSKHVTIQDSEILEPISLRSEGGRRYMYMLQGQMGLVKRCYATDARHDFMTGAKTPGPNVFVDSEGVRSNNDAGPHGNHDVNVRNRGWMRSGQGWAGAFHVVYRCSADVPVEFQSPPGATNWVIGYEGELDRKKIEFEGDEATFLEPEVKDLPHVPRSLYWSQLVAKVGGGDNAAAIVEKHVDAAGKNKYPAPLARTFVTTEEILESELKLTSHMKHKQRHEEHGGGLLEVVSLREAND
ncbi:MAG: hypothetical protein J3Q66DRAFT_389475 [Benniella sp.]|nr:MAG: hypothetical protein J3Q66DRAFT_389475 [Benniella sp.]